MTRNVVKDSIAAVQDVRPEQRARQSPSRVRGFGMFLKDHPPSVHCPSEQPTIARDSILCLLRVGIRGVVGCVNSISGVVH